jgi:HEAT repeat protein
VSPPPQRAIALTHAERQRAADVARLVRDGPGSIPRLLEMLGDPSWSVRREVIGGLGALGKAAIGPLCEVLERGRDHEGRVAATVDALVASSGEVLEELTVLAGHPNPAVVADAAQVLGRRGIARSLPVLTRLVTHPDDNVAVAAIEALGRIGGPAAIDVLIWAAQSGNFFRVFPAIDVLGRCGDPRAIPALAALLPDNIYMLEVARALGKTGESAAVAPLARLLLHPSEAVVRVAAVALADLFGRHRARYGDEAAPEAALRRAELDPAVTTRLGRSLAGAAPAEQLAIAVVLGAIGGDAALSSLFGLLDVPGPVGESAAAALKRLGKQSDEQIREALGAGDSARRRLLLPIVATLAAAPEVARCLGDPDATVRALACDALARMGAAGAVSALFPLLADSNQRVVQAASAAIQSLGSEETRALALRHASDGDPALRRGALKILSYFGFSEALPLFLAALGDEDPRTRGAALVGLAFVDEPAALEALLAASRTGDDKTRGLAMRALGMTTRDDARIGEQLRRGLEDPDAWVRYYACQALGKLALADATAAVVRLLDDPAGQVRVAAVEALTHFGNEAALDELTRLAESGEPDVQRAALVGLGMAQRPRSRAALAQAARSPDAATRLLAIAALATPAAADAVPILEAAARDPDDNVRAAALGFLAGLPGAEGSRILLELLREPAGRDGILPFLSVPADGRVPALLRALEAAGDDLAPALASALARMRTAEAKGALVQAMSLHSVPARKAAAAALASLRIPEGLSALRHAVESDPDPRVRQVCSVLLSQ